MARRQRDYKAEYQRRQAKARAEGFRSYGQKRKAKERYESEPELRRNWQQQADDVPELPVFDPMEDPRIFSAWYSAFYDPVESKRRDRNSGRAFWFVAVTGQVASFDDWEERYGTKK